MSDRKKIALMAYLVVGILTFGHSYATNPQTFAGRYDAVFTSLTAINSAIFWPLYWSVELQS